MRAALWRAAIVGGAEARSAAARCDRVRVVDREAGAHQGVDVVDLRALEQVDALTIDVDLDPADIEDAPTAEDRILEANGVKVYVDGKSIDLLQGSQIDYVDTLMGAGFTVNNPNAVAACGCGSSFRTADDSGQARACAATEAAGRPAAS